MTQEHSSIANLLATHKVWRGKRARVQQSCIDTGYAQLNQQLHYGGWPASGLIELYSEQQGIGEVQLILPALKTLQKLSGYLVFVNPPFEPNAIALRLMGINERRVIVVYSTKIAHILWSIEQGLKNKQCHGIVAWLNQNLKISQLRKLQLASETGKSLLFAYRPLAWLKQSSAAKIRLHLGCRQHTLLINIAKQPGGWAGQTVALNNTRFPQSRTITQQLPVINRSHRNHSETNTQLSQLQLYSSKALRFNA